MKKWAYYAVFLCLFILSFLCSYLIQDTSTIIGRYCTYYETSQWLREFNENRSESEGRPDRWPWLNETRAEHCRPNCNVVFIKTYKTGSTTLRNILNRYGLANNLSFVLNKDQQAGHVFKSLKKFPISRLLPPIGIREGDFANYKFNITNVHMRPSLKDLRKIMNPDSVYITILRHPVDQWLSWFQYFHKDDKMRELTSEPDPVKLFLYLPAKFNKFKSSARNIQFRDLAEADTTRYDDEDYIREQMKIFADLFDLVLLTEYFDESLILLKRLLCWTFDDILYVKMREQPKTLEADEAMRLEILKLSRADDILYSYFKERLWKMIAAYGPTFDRDLSYFRKYLNESLTACVGGSEVVRVAGNHANIRYTRNQTTPFCKNLINYSLSGEIMRRQRPTGR